MRPACLKCGAPVASASGPLIVQERGFNAEAAVPAAVCRNAACGQVTAHRASVGNPSLRWMYGRIPVTFVPGPISKVKEIVLIPTAAQLLRA
ncbi:MAG TPA: hypothetical protein VHD37_01940 [Candidatus Paceibacterota bacterium]|nr:hypothetical protein [Candidatus Paceibacterota bacterium]